MQKKILFICGLLWGCFNTATAADLMQVYNQALISDPTYHNAIATFKDKRESFPQGLAEVLPNIVGQANTSYNRVYPSTFAPYKFNTNNYAITLTQTLFNFSYIAVLHGASATVKSAFYTLLAARQNLMSRVASAYFTVLLAEDTLHFTIAQKRAVGEQLQQMRERYRVGLETMTSVYEAQASFDAIVAAEIAARNNVNNSREALRAITGHFYTHLAGLKHQVPLVRPIPNKVDQWVLQAEQQNLNLKAAHYAAITARENIKRLFAGHFPTLNAVGSFQDIHTGDSLQATFENGKQSSIGLQLNFPIYTGGLVTSQTRQAQYQYLEAVTQMEQVYRSTVSTTRQTFNSIIAGISQIEADRQAVFSRISSLNGTIASYKVGTRTIVDVLNDQQALTQAEQNYASDQYNFINNTVLLKMTAGQLCEDDLRKINSWLDESTSTSMSALPSVDLMRNAEPTTETKVSQKDKKK